MSAQLLRYRSVGHRGEIETTFVRAAPFGTLDQTACDAIFSFDGLNARDAAASDAQRNSMCGEPLRWGVEISAVEQSSGVAASRATPNGMSFEFREGARQQEEFQFDLALLRQDCAPRGPISSAILRAVSSASVRVRASLRAGGGKIRDPATGDPLK